MDEIKKPLDPQPIEIVNQVSAKFMINALKQAIVNTIKKPFKKKKKNED